MLASGCALLRLANRKYRLAVFVKLFAAIALTLFGVGPLRAQCPRPENGAIVANPNRPTVADPADITQYGVLELEYGFDHANTSARERENDLGGLLKFAVLCNLELRWDTADLVNLNGDGGASQTGTGDNWLGFQYRFLRQSGKAPSLAFGYALKFPTASVSKGFGTGRYDHQLKFLASKDLAGFHFDFNASLLVLGRQGVSGHDENAEFNLAFSHPVYKKLLFTGEFYGDTSPNPSTPAFASGLWAFTYAVTPRLVIDAGIDHGLTDGSPNRQRYFVGFTYSIADLYAHH